MRLVLRILGADVFELVTGDEQPQGRGDATSQPVGFAPPTSVAEQRWAGQGPDL